MLITKKISKPKIKFSKKPGEDILFSIVETPEIIEITETGIKITDKTKPNIKFSLIRANFKKKETHIGFLGRNF